MAQGMINGAELNALPVNDLGKEIAELSASLSTGIAVTAHGSAILNLSAAPSLGVTVAAHGSAIMSLAATPAMSITTVAKLNYRASLSAAPALRITVTMGSAFAHLGYLPDNKTYFVSRQGREFVCRRQTRKHFVPPDNDFDVPSVRRAS